MSRLAQLMARLAAARAGLPSPMPEPSRPTILFTGPAGPINASPYPLTVTLSDSSNVARVDFFKGSLQIGQALSAPYTCPAPLTYLDNGEVRFRAVVVDKQGEPREVSFTIPVAIGEPDTTAPVPVLHASATNFTADGTLTLTCVATDNTGVTGLVLTRTSGGQAPLPLTIGQDGTFTEGITRASNGTHIYTLTAFDAAGNPGSTSVTVTVDIDTAAPTVSLNALPFSVTEAGTLNLTALAAAPAGVKNVVFYWGSVSPNNIIKIEGAAPYEASRTVTAADNGPHTIIAVVTDKATPPKTAQDSKQFIVEIAPTPPPPTTLTRSRKRSDYTLPNSPLTVTKADLLAGVYGQPNAEGWYEIPDVRCHSLTPGVPCIRVQAMDVDLWVKIIRPVLDGLGVPGTNKGGLIAAEGNSTVWVDDPLLFSSPPPIGGNGVACMTARSVVASNPRELRVTRAESYGTGGIYVNGIAQGGQFRGIHVSRVGGYNIRGTGYNADGTIRFKANSRFDTSLYLGYLAQFFQIDNAPDAPEDSIIVEDWVAHNDPLAMLGRNAGQREDIWNAHASAGVLIRRALAENGLPWDPAFTGAQEVYGADPTSPSGRGYDYSGSDGLGDGYTKHGFTGTPTANDVTHLVKCQDMTSLNNLNVGFGVTAGNRCRFARVRAFTAGVIRSSAPGGYSRLAVKAAGDGTGEAGNNAVQAFQFYLAGSTPERAALFYGHEMDDLAGSFNWVDAAGKWWQRTAYIGDPNGSTGSDPNKLYASFTFRQNGVVKPPYNGGIVVIPKPTSVAGALATLDAERQARIDMFVAAGTAIGMSDRPVGDVTNYWAGVP